jgi:hypothetical protein
VRKRVADDAARTRCGMPAVRAEREPFAVELTSTASRLRQPSTPFFHPHTHIRHHTMLCVRRKRVSGHAVVQTACMTHVHECESAPHRTTPHLKIMTHTFPPALWRPRHAHMKGGEQACGCPCVCVRAWQTTRLCAFRDACLTWTRIRPVATTQPSREGRVGEGEEGVACAPWVCVRVVCVCVCVCVCVLRTRGLY